MRKKANDLTKIKQKEKIIKLPISKFIDTKFRDYAVYVLEQRGIPNFYDALTPVQRFIIKNSPSSFQKTLTVVGRSIEDGYHHGNASLESAIEKLARPFGNSMQLLEGDGFFGTEVSPEPAAARYTSVRLSPTASAVINKYNYLTTRELEGPYDPLWVECPIGLVTSIVGIAVGYKTMILPRKLKDIQDFLADKRKTIKPYFEGFSGTIEKYKDLDKSWIISSHIIVEDNKITVREIPPILKMSSVLKRLDHLTNKYEGTIKILDNSSKKVDIDIIYTGKNKTDWDEIIKFVQKSFSVIVTENLVFVKDGQVLTYDSIEEYLTDFKWQLVRLKYKNTEYERNKLDFELKFNTAKELFIQFILSKKRTDKEISDWLKPYEKDIVERLDRIPARKLTTDELSSTKELIKTLIINLKDKNKELVEDKNMFESLQDPTLIKGVANKSITVNLFETDDFVEKDGIVIWDGRDVFESEKNLEEDDE